MKKYYYVSGVERYTYYTAVKDMISLKAWQGRTKHPVYTNQFNFNE